jgi:hypothetical protein
VPSKAKSKSARRADRPRNAWTRDATAVRIGDERMRFIRIAKGEPDQPLGEVCTSVRWDDASMELTGSLTLQLDPKTLRVREGDRVRAEWASGPEAPFRRLWTMGLGAPTRGLDGSYSAELESTLGNIRQGREDFAFRRDKSHPKGWRCDQIARAVARRTGIRLGRLAKGSHRIKTLVQKNADPMDVIIKAYRAEREHTGRRFFAQWDGRLHITPLRRSTYLLELLPVIIDGTYTQERKDGFATSLVVRATAKKGKRSNRKIRLRVTDKAGVRRYGRITKSVTPPAGIDTEEEARKWGKRQLAKRQKPNRSLEVTVPLMPNLHRGDALRVRWEVDGLDQVVFVASVSHDVR